MTDAGKDTHKDLLMRLRRIEGQVRGLQRMIEADANCEEVLNQVAAVRSAINRVGMIVFQTHSKDCIYRALEGGHYENLDEIVTLMGRLMK